MIDDDRTRQAPCQSLSTSLITKSEVATVGVERSLSTVAARRTLSSLASVYEHFLGKFKTALSWPTPRDLDLKPQLPQISTRAKTVRAVCFVAYYRCRCPDGSVKSETSKLVFPESRIRRSERFGRKEATQLRTAEHPLAKNALQRDIVLTPFNSPIDQRECRY